MRFTYPLPCFSLSSSSSPSRPSLPLSFVTSLDSDLLCPFFDFSMASNESNSLLLRVIECRLWGRKRKPEFKLEGPNYEILEQIGEGGYGRVFRCRDVNTGQMVAIKQILILGVDQAVPGQIIREVSLLKELDHVNVVKLLDVTNGENYVNLVFEHLDFDLHHCITDQQYTKDSQIRKSFLYQILNAVAYCHSHKILHRDLKPSNLLIDNSKKIIKLADFGLAREFGDRDTFYTDQIATRWYRAPEVLFGSRQYSTPVDLWSVGCIFGEMVMGKCVFQATNYKDELEAIFSVLGTPDEQTWPGVTELCTYLHTFTEFRPTDLAQVFSSLEPDGLSLLYRMLCLDPNRRISAEAALKHAYFNDLNLDAKLLSNPLYC